MVTCLYEQVMNSQFSLSETESEFIKDLNIKFFNDPEYKLSEKQLKWLEIIWTK